MEHIPGYDTWKTIPSSDPKPVEQCAYCGCDLYEGDVIYRIDGGICKECLDNDYRRIL